MEKRLTTTQTNLPAHGHTLTNFVIDLMEVAVDINLIVPYPLTGPQLEEWAKHLAKSNVSPRALQFVLDLFATDVIQWNDRQGIQNVYRGLKQITKDADGQYTFHKPTP